MLDFLSLCIAPVNLLFTVMLIGVMCYWAMFLIGAVGLDFFDADVDLDLDADMDVDLHLEVDADVDLDVDADVHLDGDVDAHVDGDVHPGAEGSNHLGHHPHGSVFLTFLRFLNVGDVPLMVLLSALIGSLWAVSVLSSHYLNPELRWLVAVLWFAPNLVASVVLTKALTWPARYVFKRGNTGIAKPAKIVGKTCIITTSSVTERFGQAEIEQEGAPITLNVCSRSGSKPLKKGDEALILELVEEKNSYIVVPFDLEVN